MVGSSDSNMVSGAFLIFSLLIMSSNIASTDVAMNVYVTPRQIQAGDMFHLLAVITNMADEPTGPLSIDIAAPGLVVRSASKVTIDVPPSDIDKVVFEILAPAETKSGNYSIFVSLRSSTVVIGRVAGVFIGSNPLTVNSLLLQFATGPFGPIAIAALVFTAWTKWYFESKKASKVTYETKVAQDMTVTVLDNTKKYYQPYATAFGNLSYWLGNWSNLRRARKNTDEQSPQEVDAVKSSFYWYCLQYSWRSKMRKEAAVFMFKSSGRSVRKLDNLYRDCALTIRKASNLTPEDSSHIESTVKPDSDFGDFIRLLNSDKPLHEMFSKFGNISQDVATLERVSGLANKYTKGFEKQLGLIWKPWFKA